MTLWQDGAHTYHHTIIVLRRLDETQVSNEQRTVCLWGELNGIPALSTPPPSRYFGLSSYVWRRQGNFGLVTSRVVSATIANEQVNMLTMRNATTQQPAFDQPLVLVSTADAATFKAIKRAFVQSGVPSDAINLEAIPRVKFGRSLILDGADDLTFSLRSALWPGNNALGEYAKLEWTSVFIARSPRGGSRLTQPLEAIAPSPSEQVGWLRSSFIVSFIIYFIHVCHVY